METYRKSAGRKVAVGVTVAGLVVAGLASTFGAPAVAAEEDGGSDVAASDAVQFDYADGVEQDPVLSAAVLELVNARSTSLKMQAGASEVERLDSLAAQGRSVQMRVDREDGGWAQGVAYVVAPEVEGAMPEGWVFFAEQAGSGWNVYLEGDPGFFDAAAASGTTTAEERPVYREGGSANTALSSRAVSANTQMQFPVKAGSWFYMGSPHANNGSSGPLSSVDISGSDGTVRSTRGGNAINMCNGWTRIIHNNGYSTDYYHINGSRQLTGAIGQNVVLGNQGTSLCAGGAAYGNHVHFSLREYDANMNGWYVSLNNKIIGNHRIYTGGNYTGGSTVDITNGNTGNLPGNRWNY